VPDRPAPDPGHFNAHAAVYDRGRPPYPQALWDRLQELEVLGHCTRVVDLGAGSGQATGPMLRAGATVTAVEPGPALAAFLIERWPEITVHTQTAEEVTLPTGAFDLAVVATAVHWFELGVVLPKLHRALVPGGHLGVWRTVFGDPAAPVTPFRERVRQITARRTDPLPRPGPGELDTDSWAALLTSTGHFAVTRTEEFAWEAVLTTEQVRDLFTTFSNWTASEVEDAARAAEDLGGKVLEHYLTPLILLERLPGHRWGETRLALSSGASVVTVATSTRGEDAHRYEAGRVRARAHRTGADRRGVRPTRGHRRLQRLDGRHRKHAEAHP
jgi:SAM-dependent methyltransferase